MAKPVFIVERVDSLVCGWLEVLLWRGDEELQLVRNGHDEWRVAFFAPVLFVAALFPRLYSVRCLRCSHNHLPFAIFFQRRIYARPGRDRPPRVKPRNNCSPL